jgi:hypothetical protein
MRSLTMKTKKAKITGPGRNAHTADTKYGMGDYYGTGIKAKVGREIGGYSPMMNPVQPNALKKPPKSLA